ncbi:metallophosphoesterase family protein [Paenibacillus lactis]|uniref:3',5'-cyclic AMP phosphodiesterase CpdA n=1 Tax=Paenibacillus lactis TaxID=228574 RepID=A0ABS4F4S6_9BACL|nr:metallophosphoesterase family protein [Paenibacillus lactis]MBP1891264.1 3',5'-cyclic AMP phosphodiesterase CpdA [Paenibacillus lactis]HAF98363.1 metallophosphoesterase [Paenibacillus lactis]
MKPVLRFKEDQTFTIVQFTDIHWRNGDAQDLASRQCMEAVLDLEQPDLVVFTGDIIYTGETGDSSASCLDPVQAFKDAVFAAESRGIRWAFVFGNHDTEGDITREELMKAAMDLPGCCSEPGPPEISGVGNYTLPIYGKGEDTAEAVLYFFDSGEMSQHPAVEGYDWIRRDQIRWYEMASAAYSVKRGGDSMPALAFFHIPIPEYRDVWERRTCYGNKFEAVCCPQLNTGLFAAMLERGDVMGTFAGHDHINDYWGELYGIRLCYGRATGYGTYGREGMLRGARVIRLHEGQRQFDTWITLSDGSQIREQEKHEPETPL